MRKKKKGLSVEEINRLVKKHTLPVWVDAIVEDNVIWEELQKKKAERNKREG